MSRTTPFPSLFNTKSNFIILNLLSLSGSDWLCRFARQITLNNCYSCQQDFVGGILDWAVAHSTSSLFYPISLDLRNTFQHHQRKRDASSDVHFFKIFLLTCVTNSLSVIHNYDALGRINANYFLTRFWTRFETPMAPAGQTRRHR